MKKLINKYIFSVLCAFIATITLSSNAFASTVDPTIQIDEIYQSVYDSSTKINIDKINSDESAYALLKQNINLIKFNSDGTIYVDYISLLNLNNLYKSDIDFIKDFVTRLNNLINLSAIKVDNNLLISSVKDVKRNNSILPRIPIIDIMGETRLHATKLKSVYDNAIFTTKHLVAGQYFAERVKTGGDWDYKSYLGTKTLYYVEDLNRNMTGEDIGNFHYGYVGRSVFSATTLKSSAGMYQIYSGTSNIKYWDSFFDDPKDQYEIQKGIDKYNSEH